MSINSANDSTNTYLFQEDKTTTITLLFFLTCLCKGAINFHNEHLHKISNWGIHFSK